MIEDVAAALADAGSLTAKELRDVLRGQGRVSMTTADVTRALDGQPGRFRCDEDDPPRWNVRTPGSMIQLPATNAEDGLYRWQTEALAAWRRQRCRGVVEAVTGTGKTRLGVAAILETLNSGGQAVVLVPTCELLHQWRGVLQQVLRPGVHIGLLGDGEKGSLNQDDVLVAVVNSARDAVSPRRPGSLLVGDECHRYASASNRLALNKAFPRRLGLTATLERPDGGHIEWLAPYFGRTCFRMGYARATRDGVVARFALALIAVRFSAEERDHYEMLTDAMRVYRAILLASGEVRHEPFGAFLQDVAALARGDGPLAATARAYLSHMAQRRELLSETPAKSAALHSLQGPLRAAERALVFTQTVTAAEAAARVVRTLGLPAEAIHSDLPTAARRSVLARFASGELRVATAPQVLDEGIDVPAADLAIVLAASRSRRQMTQRMGRVLRRKPDGRLARFVVVFVQDTVEDPAFGAHEGFLDEVTTVAARTARFSAKDRPEQIRAFLAPESSPAP